MSSGNRPEDGWASYSIFDRSRVIRLIIDIEKLPLKRPKNRQNIKQKNKAIKIDF